MSRTGRSQIIGYEGMRHAPENELGVVYLFSKMARRLGFVEIDVIQPFFPDCWAYRRTLTGVQRTWIEFEFKSKGFSNHLRQLRGLTPKKGVVVCWQHNWSECDRYAEVIELQSLGGFGRRVWVQNTLPKFQRSLDDTPRRRRKEWRWSVAPSARPSDIVLMYRAGKRQDAIANEADPDLLQSIANIFRVETIPQKRGRYGYGATVTQLVRLRNPLRLAQMKSDRVLKDAPFIRRDMLGRSDASPYWYRIYDLILGLNRNRETLRRLKPYRPECF